MFKWFKVKKIISDAKKLIPYEVRMDDYKDEYLALYEKFLFKIEEALRINPKSLEALQEKFFALRTINKFDDCIFTGKKLLERLPKDGFDTVHARSIIGDCYYLLKDFENAKRFYQSTIAIKPYRDYGVEVEIQKAVKEKLDELNA